ncbi:MAG: hypothetical protein FWC56_01225 [Phycisphaerae bacterium]|nr:hypothetical protein [Phycisphaerae bacterium]
MGETMNPLGPTIVEAKLDGLHIDWTRLLDLGPPAFGIAVFPLIRELAILLTAWLLLLPQNGRRGQEHGRARGFLWGRPLCLPQVDGQAHGRGRERAVVTLGFFLAALFIVCWAG